MASAQLAWDPAPASVAGRADAVLLRSTCALGVKPRFLPLHMPCLSSTQLCPPSQRLAHPPASRPAARRECLPPALGKDLGEAMRFDVNRAGRTVTTTHHIKTFLAHIRCLTLIANPAPPPPDILQAPYLQGPWHSHTPHLVPNVAVERGDAAPCRRVINHIVVQQAGHMDGLRDLRQALLPPPKLGRKL
eukprot:227243-Chlamydomonas_euryale.AAC.21